MRLPMVSRRALADVARVRYVHADSALKAKILDEFVANTGYHRKYAIRLIKHPPEPRPKERRHRGRTYAAGLVQALVFIWQVCGQICSRRLKPFLPTMATLLVQLGHLRLTDEERWLLVKVSRTTIDRLLGPVRRQQRPHGRSTTKPGSLLKKAIPVHASSDWREDRPGFLEIDLVAHCGEKTMGDYLCTLDAIDLATGWSECIVPANRGQHAVCEALKTLRKRLPFPLQGVDSDNDGSFINELPFGYCQTERIAFTRCRPYKKNDQAHIEQKNWSIVRQQIGYDRYETEASGVLNAFWQEFRSYTNFFQPVLKLKEKTHVDGKVKKVYDEAQTPYQRVMASPHVIQTDKERLSQLFVSLDPVLLKRSLDQRLQIIWERYRARFPNEATNPSK